MHPFLYRCLRYRCGPKQSHHAKGLICFLLGQSKIPTINTLEMQKAGCADPGGGGAANKVCCGAEAAGASGGVSMTGTARVVISVHAQQSLLHVPRVRGRPGMLPTPHIAVLRRLQYTRLWTCCSVYSCIQPYIWTQSQLKRSVLIAGS